MKYLLIIVALYLHCPAWGQGLTVLDPEGEPLPGAQVTFWELEGGALVSMLSSAEGKAAVPPGLKGRLRIEVGLWGYQTFQDTLGVGESRTVYLAAEAFPMEQVVITAQYAPSAAGKSLHKVKVIDRKKIEAMAAVNLSDALRNELNMRVSRDNILGSGANLQGLGGQNVKVLIDGVPVIGRLDGDIDLSQINLGEVERIEVVEGPMSVNFGSDALAGVINLVTRKAGKSGFEAKLNSYYESAGQYNLDGRLGLRKGSHAASLSLGRNYFDGWSPRDPFLHYPRPMPADTNRFVPWKPKEQYFGRIQYQASLKSFQIRPYADYFYERILNRGYPREPYQETAFDETYRTWRKTAGLQVSRESPGGKNYRMVAAWNGYQRIKNTWFKDLTTLAGELSSAPSDQDTSRYGQWMSRGSYSTSRDSARINFELGYEVSHETADGVRIENQHQAQSEAALYASAELSPWSGLLVRPGLRFSRNSAYPAPLAPSLHLRQGLRLPGKRSGSLDLRLSYARGFRAPSLKELYFEFVDINHNIVGNPDLLAEYSHNLQGGLEWRHAGAKSRCKLEAGAYLNDVRNLISLVQIGTSTAYSYQNIGRFRSVGFQGNAEWVRDNFSASLGGAVVGRSNQVAAEQADVPALSFSPEVRASLQYEWAGPKISLAAFYKFTGTLPGYALDEQGDLFQTRIASYQMLDLTVSREFFRKSIRLSAGGKNLFNVQNIAAFGTTSGGHSSATGALPLSWGRSIFISMQIKINSKP